MSARYRQLAAHVRGLPDDDLNDLLVDLPRHRFAELVDAALTHPVLPVGLQLRLRPAAPDKGWTVLAGAPARPLGTVTRGHPDGQPGGRVGWRAWTRAGDPVAIGGLCWWRRRADAAGGVGLGDPRQWRPLPGPGRPRPRQGGRGAQRPAGGAAGRAVRRPAGRRLRR